ncbi:MAG: hypothetical protein AB1Z51_05865 [Desulfuromonadales bacterium]
MKEQSQLKMFILVFLACAGILLLTGAATVVTTSGRYQIAVFSAASGTSDVRGWSGYHILDTHTGKVVESIVEQQDDQ